MDAWTLREAAERTSRSVTTLRRYIRSGRLEAVKRPGRFGPEYFVSARGLGDAGLEVDADSPAPRALESRRARDFTSAGADLPTVRADAVPITLYQELQLKHEQLLVQYGMVRANGLHAFELRSELEAERRQLAEAREQVERLERELAAETARLRREVQHAELEQEGALVENVALREKVRGLEMITRNARTTESIEWQFREVMEQAHRVERLTSQLSAETDAGHERPERPPERDH